MKKTVMILGAGASCEVKLPTGEQLMDKIAQLLDIRYDAGHLVNGDEAIAEALWTWARLQQPPVREITKLIHAARSIKNAMHQSQSIDNYLDAHRGNAAVELCGKLAIARAILTAERESALFTKDGTGVSFEKIKGTWLAKFAKLLRENCTAERLSERLSHLALIIFNYDRCFEHFLSHDLEAYYGIPLEKAEQLVKNIEIYHPYGTVGDLPGWCLGRREVGFGGEVDSETLVDVAGKIKTFTERVAEDESVSNMRNLVATADRLVFLGFAYWRMNLDLIMPIRSSRNRESDRICFGTTMQMSESNEGKVRTELGLRRELDPGCVTLSKTTCAAFIDEHSRWLSFV